MQQSDGRLLGWDGKPREPLCDCDDSMCLDGAECNRPAVWIVSAHDVEFYCCDRHLRERGYVGRPVMTHPGGADRTEVGRATE